MGLQLVAAASEPVFAPAAMRLHCAIEPTNTTFDPLLTDYIAAATSMVEEFTGRSLGQQRWLLSLPSFLDAIVLPRGPVTAVSSVAYTDTAGSERLLANDAYVLDIASDPQVIVRPTDMAWPATKPGPNMVRITFVTGYASAPPLIAQAVRATVAAWFLTREATALPAGVATMLEPFVAKWIFA